MKKKVCIGRLESLFASVRNGDRCIWNRRTRTRWNLGMWLSVCMMGLWFIFYPELLLEESTVENYSMEEILHAEANQIQYRCYLWDQFIVWYENRECEQTP